MNRSGRDACSTLVRQRQRHVCELRGGMAAVQEQDDAEARAALTYGG